MLKKAAVPAEHCLPVLEEEVRQAMQSLKEGKSSCGGYAPAEILRRESKEYTKVVQNHRKYSMRRDSQSNELNPWDNKSRSSQSEKSAMRRYNAMVNSRSTTMSIFLIYDE
ncbi:hypothetical protein PoB_000883700 [Plakobranchus ocellatus]|uniref:Uncharacterized protein n=1 Tax=Plakobranchus ocellatus TaxID=259542 RepID=A0AAV3YIY1_9GAST|nr:hypothetical protein PoB_000883700 [Plakobranchus ocellatus]